MALSMFEKLFYQAGYLAMIVKKTGREIMCVRFMIFPATKLFIAKVPRNEEESTCLLLMMRVRFNRGTSCSSARDKKRLCDILNNPDRDGCRIYTSANTGVKAARRNDC